MQDSNILNVTAYYFSGTGNAYNAARWIKNISEQRHISAQCVDISKVKRDDNLNPLENSLIGFVSPTHGFNFPPLMFHFLLKFPKVKNCKAFIINTRGGLKVGKYFLPGLSGLAQFFSAIVLRLKGFKVIGMRPIDLPSNWISLHPGLKPKVIESIYKKRKTEVEQFANKILDGKTDYKALRDIIQDLAIAPVSVFYYFFGRFLFAKSYIASKKCNSCNLCVKQCPVSAIKLIDKRPFWTRKCESCMHCMNICPQRAIETPHGFIIGLFFIVNVFILSYAHRTFGIEEYLIGLTPVWLAKMVILIFDTLIFFTCLFISYRLQHYLLRFRIFERIIVYTSLTKYKFWRRYKFKKITLDT